MVATINNDNAFVSQEERDLAIHVLREIIRIRLFRVGDGLTYDGAGWDTRPNAGGTNDFIDELLKGIREDRYITRHGRFTWSWLPRFRTDARARLRLFDIIGDVRHPLHETGELSGRGLILSVVWYFVTKNDNEMLQDTEFRIFEQYDHSVDVEEEEDDVEPVPEDDEEEEEEDDE